MRDDCAVVRGWSMTILGDSNPLHLLFGAPITVSYDLRCRRVTFAPGLLPALRYSISSVCQLVACSVLSSRRSSWAMRSVSRCHSGTEMVGVMRISVLRAR